VAEAAQAVGSSDRA